MNIINGVRQKDCAIIFIICLRYLIGGAFVFSAIVKIRGDRIMIKDGTNYSLKSLQHYFEMIYQLG